MTFKDLNITNTTLFYPRFNERQDKYDAQFNEYLLPFQVNDEVYLIDTYHIKIFGDNPIKYYKRYLEKLDECNVIYDHIPFVENFSFKHAYKITSQEDLEYWFYYICDLKDYRCCDGDTSNDYSSFVSKNVCLTYRDSECLTMLVKKQASKKLDLQLQNLRSQIFKAIEKPSVKCDCEYKIEDLKQLISKNSICDWDKKECNKILEWYDYMSKISEEIDKKYEEIFFERGK